jgi:hypothetical protein
MPGFCAEGSERTEVSHVACSYGLRETLSAFDDKSPHSSYDMQLNIRSQSCSFVYRVRVRVETRGSHSSCSGVECLRPPRSKLGQMLSSLSLSFQVPFEE